MYKHHCQLNDLLTMLKIKPNAKRNIFILNMIDTDSFYDDKRHLAELLYDLELNKSMIDSFSRIGGFSLKPCLLRI